MGRVTKLSVKNFKSIRERVDVTFPGSGPLVIVGPNNVGKSNLVRAMELVLGEGWPSSFQPEDHDFFNRDRANVPLDITVEVEGVVHASKYGDVPIKAFCLNCGDGEEKPFFMVDQHGKANTFVSNATREQCRTILVSADRRLSYQLGYSSKYTLLSKLMRKFHDALTADVPRVAGLKEKFEEIKSSFEGIGEFSTFAEELKKQTEELSKNWRYKLEVDFSAYDPSK